MGNLVLDGSSPAIVFTAAGATATTASFTPPAGARLVALAAMNNGSGNTPPVPSIAGGGLTWTLLGHSARPDTPASDGHSAAWTAVAAGSAMTVAVTNGDPAFGTAVKVLVFTDDAGGTPATGAVKEGGAAIAGTTTSDSYTGTVDGSRGVMAWADWAAASVPTAGAATTLTGGGAANPGQIAYAFALQATNGGTDGGVTTLNLAHSSTNARRWILVEVTPVEAPPPTEVPTGQATETSTATAIGRRKIRTVGQAADTSTATTVARRKARTAGQATETSTATSPGRRKAKDISQAATTETGHPATAVKTATVGLATETTTASAMTIGLQVIRRPGAGTISRPDSGTILRP